jgi:hypothetical protein
LLVSLLKATVCELFILNLVIQQILIFVFGTCLFGPFSATLTHPIAAGTVAVGVLSMWSKSLVI